METTRQQKIAKQIQRDMAEIFQKEGAEIVRGVLVTVTAVRVSPDFSYAKIYVSILEEADRAPMMAALKKAAGFVRHELGQSMIIRYAPEILFEEDHNIEYGIHIASVLKQVRSEEETNDESSDGQE